MDTRKKILDKALEMFNERGIEYVGLRELAAILDIRVSNITYYFPTKDDLVYALSLELGKANAEVIVERENLTMSAFLKMLREVFQNHIAFRCLLLSVVHLMKQNKHLSEAYKHTQKVRNAAMYSNLQALERSGYLKPKDKAEMDFLVSGISLISRFWISEAAISFDQLTVDEQIRHYLILISKLLSPYSTKKAIKEMDVFL
ncbi:MAG TPA: TetR/AcrR family transcriptional regulator [Segetibacter sp.]|nr:TetR/AcrR family transcriptional regulator [Segetibacter sp.]